MAINPNSINVVFSERLSVIINCKSNIPCSLIPIHVFIDVDKALKHNINVDNLYENSLETRHSKESNI